MSFKPNTINYDFTITEDIFEHYVGRKPESQAELDEFSIRVKKGMENQLDWDIIYNNAGREVE